MICLKQKYHESYTFQQKFSVISSGLWHRVLGVYRRFGESCCIHLQSLNFNVSLKHTNVKLILITCIFFNENCRHRNEKGPNSNYTTALGSAAVVEVIVSRRSSSLWPREWRFPEMGKRKRHICIVSATTCMLSHCGTLAMPFRPYITNSCWFMNTIPAVVAPCFASRTTSTCQVLAWNHAA
jgi:hypothetical protein